MNSGYSPKCKISDILEPNGVDNLGEKEERKDPEGRKCHGEDGLGVAPHCVSSETEKEVRMGKRSQLSSDLCCEPARTMKRMVLTSGRKMLSKRTILTANTPPFSRQHFTVLSMMFGSDFL